MQQTGTPIDEVGTLVRDGGAFYLRRDLGGRYLLELQRTPVDLVEKRVRLRGTLVGPDLVNALGVAPE
jgi:glycerol-3-phosphate O-acyltransferase